MSYQLRTGLTELLIDGEVVAHAHVSDDAEPDGRWYVGLGNNLGFTVSDHRKAELILKWIGDRLSPTLEVISGPEDLRYAQPEAVWYTDYNGGNRYRLRTDGRQEYSCPGAREWSACSDGKPFHAVYPLRARRYSTD